MSNRKQCPQEDANPPNDDVGDAQKRILAPHDRSSGDEDRFRAAVDGDIEVLYC